jgi:hypothetical protein
LHTMSTLIFTLEQSTDFFCVWYIHFKHDRALWLVTMFVAYNTT